MLSCLEKLRLKESRNTVPFKQQWSKPSKTLIMASKGFRFGKG